VASHWPLASQVLLAPQILPLASQLLLLASQVLPASQILPRAWQILPPSAQVLLRSGAARPQGAWSKASADW
jgi:hypothetical protein